MIKRALPAKFFLLLLLATQGVTGQQEDGFGPGFIVSEKPVLPIAKDQEFIFGYLEVPERRNRPASGTIRLPVYIFKSRSANAEPDPVIYTVGGPGGSTMPSAQYMNAYRYLDQRDFILIEQRGTRYAEPSLACPEWTAAVASARLPGTDSSRTDSLMVRAAQACKKRLTAQGIDLDGYRTTEIAADIADLARALHLEQYNLLTLSYSTKIAQVLLRDYPEGIRSVVMDSPLPLQVNYDEESVGNLLKTLKLLLADCASDPACNKAFPDLQTRFMGFLRERDTIPLQVEIPHPKSGEMQHFSLAGKDLISIFGAASTYDVPGLPKRIHQLLSGDLEEIKIMLSGLFQKPGPGHGLGMRLSVWCAEEYPFADPQVIARETSAYPEVRGLSPAVFSGAVCRTWGVEPAAPLENEAIHSEVPVLLISGSYDSETPPWWAEDMKASLPNSFHLVFPGWRHTPTTTWGKTCAMEAADAFFNNPHEFPQTDCIQELGPPRFTTE